MPSLENLPSLSREDFLVPDLTRLAGTARATHAPRILLLYGSLRTGQG